MEQEHQSQIHTMALLSFQTIPSPAPNISPNPGFFSPAKSQGGVGGGKTEPSELGVPLGIPKSRAVPIPALLGPRELHPKGFGGGQDTLQGREGQGCLTERTPDSAALETPKNQFKIPSEQQGGHQTPSPRASSCRDSDGEKGQSCCFGDFSAQPELDKSQECGLLPSTVFVIEGAP